MAKKYQTQGNFRKLWKHIDNASSEMNLALELMKDMNLEKHSEGEGVFLQDNNDYRQLEFMIDRFDYDKFSLMMNLIEDIMEAKGFKLFDQKVEEK